MTVRNMISSDSHIIEPPDLWLERIAPAFRERAPRVVAEDGGDWWYIDGKRSMSFVGIQTGERFDRDASELRTEGSKAEVCVGAFAGCGREHQLDTLWNAPLRQ